jgi:hypothetical protein
MIQKLSNKFNTMNTFANISILQRMSREKCVLREEDHREFGHSKKRSPDPELRKFSGRRVVDKKLSDLNK